jgi:uncharacterized glyoxalase superfamily protein PhnB
MGYKPEGFSTITPYLIVDGAAEWLDFVKAAFGAEELSRSESDGRIAHAHLRIGDSMIEVSDANEQWRSVPCALHVYVEDARSVYAKAVGAGASSLYEPSVKPYGDLEGGITDRWGNQWYIATHSGSWTEAKGGG